MSNRHVPVRRVAPVRPRGTYALVNGGIGGIFERRKALSGIGYKGEVLVDVPAEVRRRVIADKNAPWLDELPALVASLARDWSLNVGSSLRGGVGAVVLEAKMADHTDAVLKITVPGVHRELTFEAAALALADGDGCVTLLRQDLDRGALLIERLGPAMYDVVPDPRTQHDLLCDLAVRMWRPIGPGVNLPSGADKAAEYASVLPQLWEETGRPCSRTTVEDAIDCIDRRRRAHDDRRAVLVHGDIHETNALQSEDGTFKLIDPVGLRAEPACDLGTIIRCSPASGDDLRLRTERLALRTGVDATSIWEWGTIHRVMGGLVSRRIGFQPFGDLLLAEADRLTAQPM